ncbi:MAG: radical SAM protein, partial [Planctomycetota bacterium]
KFLSRNTLKKLFRNPRYAITMGTHKVITQVSATYFNGYSPFPKNLTFFLTYRCNLNCHVCGQWGTNGYVSKLSSKSRDEVDVDTLRKVIDEIAPHKPVITMCGGEVLLYKDWYAFMSHVKSKGLTCILTTNGTMIEKYAEELVDIGLDKLCLSLDGPESVHNKARGSHDIFQTAIRGIETINRYKKRKSKKLPLIEIGCTISDQNYRYLDDVVDIAEDLDVSCLIFLHLAFLTDNELSRQTKLFRELFQTDSIHWSGYRYKPDGIDTVYLSNKLEEIESHKRKFPIVVHPDFTKEEIKKYYRASFFLSTSYKPSCLAPWNTVYVLPNGDISPCSSFVAGNIREGSFKEIWNNNKFRYFRTELKKRTFFPVCPRCCEFYKH